MGSNFVPGNTLAEGKREFIRRKASAPRLDDPRATSLVAVSPARRTAFDLLSRIGATSLHSDDALHGSALAQLSEADRHLATALVLGVLRWQIALDSRIRQLLSRPEIPLGEPVAIALRLGAFQLLHMDRIPAHAAVHESVELVRSTGQTQAAGMTNALLRKLASAQAPRRPLVESLPAMAERMSHPLWLAERWTKAYGRVAAEQICAFDQTEPARAEIFRESAEGDRSPVMDAGSRLVAELAARVGAEAQRVWDCCAAPGGKTLILAQRLPQAEILATDASPMRLRRMEERLRRELPGNLPTTTEARAEALPPTHGAFDLILCDVPCSGTGTLARNPEIRHRLRPEDLQRQAERQMQILRAALSRLNPGGRLVYSTCSLEVEECTHVVEAVLGTVGDSVRQLSLEPFLEQLRSSHQLAVEEPQTLGWMREGCLRTLPGAGFPGDGFFAAAFERR